MQFNHKGPVIFFNQLNTKAFWETEVQFERFKRFFLIFHGVGLALFS